MSEPSSETAASPDGSVGRVLCTPIGVGTHIAPSGPLFDEDTLEELRMETFACAERGRVQLTMDLSSMQQVSSAALELFAEAQDKLAVLGGWLKLARMNDTAREVIHITGLSDYIGVLDEGETPAFAEDVAAGGRLGDRLIAKGLLSKAQVDQAMVLQDALGRRLGQIIIERGWVPETKVLGTLAEQLGIPFVRLRVGMYDSASVRSLERSVIERLRVVPLFRIRDEVTLATADPQSVPSIQEVEERLSCSVRLVLATREEILKTLADACQDTSLTDELIGDLDEDLVLVDSAIPDDFSVIDEMAGGSPVINTVNSIIQRAVRDGASDVHLEPGRVRSRVRYRIDGVLYEVMTPRAELHPALVSRLKVMANLDIAERRLPQDGRIQVQTQGRAVDLRFSSLPSLNGEKIVLRVLDKNKTILDIDKLGLSEHNATAFNRLLAGNYGLILVTGPTGSGKTTSLYAALNYLNSMEKNIVTIEDPVEYQLEIVNQNEVRPAIGLGFAKILKHVLRQDPDVVMVGEIREQETAEIAVQAALTGHLVLSTLHTNDSVGAVTRMIDMGIEPYLLSSALIGVVAQRLLRTICPACKTTYMAPVELTSRYGWPEGSTQLARGRGCPECFDSGYRGRIAIHEILETDPELAALILTNPSRDQLTDFFGAKGCRSLFDEGIEKVSDQASTIEEVGRVVNLAQQLV